MKVSSKKHDPKFPKTILQSRSPSSETKAQANQPREAMRLSSTLKKGAEIVAGTATAMVLAPATLVKPLTSSSNLPTLKLLLLGSCLAGAAVANVIFGPAGGLVGAICMSIGAITAVATPRERVLQAQIKARENTEGSRAKKAGAALRAGYKQALQDSYELGASAVGKSVKLVSHCSQSAHDFTEGAIWG